MLTPLLVAITFNAIETIKLLTNIEPNINDKNNLEITALTMAIACNSTELTQLLIENGAILDVPAISKLHLTKEMKNLLTLNGLDQNS